MVVDVVTNIDEDLVCGRKMVTINHKIVSFLVATLAVFVFVITSCGY